MSILLHFMCFCDILSLHSFLCVIVMFGLEYNTNGNFDGTKVEHLIMT